MSRSELGVTTAVNQLASAEFGILVFRWFKHSVFKPLRPLLMILSAAWLAFLPERSLIEVRTALLVCDPK